MNTENGNIAPFASRTIKSGEKNDSSLSPGKTERTACLLILDDEKSILQSMELSLKIHSGYTVVTTDNPDTALELIKTAPHRFDLVITDEAMPTMSGIEFSKLALRLNPSLPIVLCSGFLDAEKMESAKKTGIAKVVNKPVELQTLAEIIRRLLEKNACPVSSR